jgi:hypothetical protein
MAAPRLCTTTRAKKIIIITFLMVAIVNLSTFYTKKYIADPATGKV